MDDEHETEPSYTLTPGQSEGASDTVIDYAGTYNPRIRGLIIATSVVTTVVDPAEKYAYVTDESTHEIRRMDLTTGMVTTIAGSGTNGTSDGNGGTSCHD